MGMRPCVKPVGFFLTVIYVIILGISSTSRADEPLEQKIRSEEKKLEQIKREIEEKKKASKKTARQEENLSAELKKLESRLQEQQKKIKTLNLRLKRTKGEIRDIQGGIARLSSEMDARRDGLRQILKRSTLLSSNRQDLGAFPDLRNLEGMSQDLYVRSLVSGGFGTWENLAAEKERSESRLTRLEGTYRGLSKEQSTLLRQKQSVTKEGQQKRSQLSQVQKQKEAYEKEIHDLEAASARVKNLLATYERTAKASKDLGFSQQKGKLPWPMEGHLASNFGRQKHPEFDAVMERNGVEITARGRNDVRVVYDGAVIFADWFRGYGKMVIVDHGGKYYSVYAHADKILVAKGAKVKKGQQIAEIGGAGSDGKEETLYFEIRHGGSPEDPMIWLKSR